VGIEQMDGRSRGNGGRRRTSTSMRSLAGMEASRRRRSPVVASTSWVGGSTLQWTRRWACCLAAPGWMVPAPVGTTQLSFSRRLSSCCGGFVSWCAVPAAGPAGALVARAGLGGDYRFQQLTDARSASYWPIAMPSPERRCST
jgi:hypothetical protein